MNLRSRCAGIRDKMDKIINKVWFMCNRKRYIAFKNRVIKEGRDPNNIWWHYKLGFICW
jgi:hypothetical protein